MESEPELNPSTTAPTVDQPAVLPNSKRSNRQRLLALAIAGVLLYYGGTSAAHWYRAGEDRTLSLANIRRVGLGTLLYAQDWDSNVMPPPREVAHREWVTWPTLVRPYVSPDSSFSNPANPVVPFRSSLRDPIHDYNVNSSYAINKRFWNTFAPGPFPLDNLELPEQTVLFVEAGRMWRTPTKDDYDRNAAFTEYSDTTERFAGLCPYPSAHGGRMAVVAADGHGILLTVVHYTPKDGAHDPLYGRIGNSIYNWNGGHVNGNTDLPAKD